jgi:hypothetical protein
MKKRLVEIEARCAWCNRRFGRRTGRYPKAGATHGICRACCALLLAGVEFAGVSEQQKQEVLNLTEEVC